MSVNNNYIPLLSMGGPGAAASSYVGQSVGAFNELFADGSPDNRRSFAAFVAFVISGDYANFTNDVASPPDAQWLWGNYDLAAKVGVGWSITLEPSLAGQGTILARVANGAGDTIEAQSLISGAGFASPVEHVILATLLYSTTGGASPNAIVALGLNGSIVSTSLNEITDGYAPSPFAARLGADAGTGNTVLSPTVQFISCGFSPVGPLQQAGASGGPMTFFGQLIGDSWRAFAASLGGMNLVTTDFGLDWKRRYNVASLASGISSTTVKTASGVFVTGNMASYAVPPDALPDIGNQSPVLGNPPPAVLPVNLVKSGANAQRLLGVKNLPFFTPPALTFPT